MAEDAALADPYSSQKANIRDTVKYLAGAYAACGTLLFAGLSLSNIGTHGYGRLAIILLAGSIAFGFVCASIGAIFRVLNGDFCFPHGLEQPAKNFLQQHAEDLFPRGMRNYDALLAAKDKLEIEVEMVRARWQTLAAGSAQDADRAALKARYDDAVAMLAVYNVAVTRAVSLAHLFLLQRRLAGLQAALTRWTIGAILATMVAAYAVTLPSQPDCSRCMGGLVTHIA